MKWTSQTSFYAEIAQNPRKVNFSSGLIGLPELKRFELFLKKEELPFLRLNALDDESIGFLAIDPFAFVKDYCPEINENEVKAMKIKAPNDVAILVLATFSRPKTKITVNLMAPIFLHRTLRSGKQIVIENYRQVSATHLIYEEK